MLMLLMQVGKGPHFEALALGFASTDFCEFASIS
jgi:hypothetical protein